MAFQYNPATKAFRCACGGFLNRAPEADRFFLDEVQNGYVCATCKDISQLGWQAQIEKPITAPTVG